uniref:CCHC-type domain-containing protein n=1 Tax=Nicotiana tabacum TaxID=4097 RepID=A0A1S4A420_TOBAC|nr:PREDICTED: uncharacterized protein LOC107793499 [Nicotiana tabacum]
MAEDSELWDIICDGPHVHMKKLEETGPMVPKDKKEYSDIDKKAIEKNYHAKKILVCCIGPDEYNRVSACDTAKEIWEALQTAHKGTTQVKQSKIDMITTENKGSERRELKKEKNLVLKAKSSDSSAEDSDMAYLTKRFQKMVRRNGGIPKRGSTSKARNNDICHRCRKPGHFIKDCPLAK